MRLRLEAAFLLLTTILCSLLSIHFRIIKERVLYCAGRAPLYVLLVTFYYASYSAGSSSTVATGSSPGFLSSICMDRATTLV